MIKPLILSARDISGGAARATYRLHRGLRGIGVESRMLVQSKASEDYTVIAPQTRLDKALSGQRHNLDELPFRLYPRRELVNYSTQWLPDLVHKKISQLNPDVINLHWICRGYLRIESISKLSKPVVWSLHDMWPFTGGCHYDQGCGRYTGSCGDCPQLHSRRDKDLSRWIWRRKAKSGQNADITIVALSQWLADCARKSSLFKDLRIEVIPNSLDIARFKPIDKRMSREILNLPQDKKLVLFGAMGATRDLRKGFDLLQATLKSLGQTDWKDKARLVIFGASKPERHVDLGIPAYYMGTLKDDISLSLLYSAADVFVAPSRQDNLPNTVMESIACGTPCAVFNIGGMPDMIDHQENGYLAEPFETGDLVHGITWILEDRERHRKLSYHARQKAEREYGLELQARRYMALYKELVTE